MLTWLTSRATLPRPRSRAVLISRPASMRNSTTPSWARTLRLGTIDAGSTTAAPAGQMAPSTDGPRMMPAAISPMTGGWPMRIISMPASLQAATTTDTAISSVISGKPAFSGPNVAVVSPPRLSNTIAITAGTTTKAP